MKHLKISDNKKVPMIGNLSRMNNPETLAPLATRHRKKTNKTKKHHIENLNKCKVILLFCKKKYESV